jgi:metallophosphoesterase (TIGR00282 family)
MHNKKTYTFMEEQTEMLRPINFGESAPGRGYTILDCNGYRVLVISAMGNVHIEPTLDNPFEFIDRVLRDEAGKYDFSILDIHAEATGEKLAIGYGYDGKINIIFGTHTHVKTADLQILPNGTGYITDVGMCGESGGVIGMDAECVVERMRTRLPKKFVAANGAPVADGAIFNIDTSSGRVTSVESVKF